MARLRRSKRIATSATKITDQSGTSPTSRLAMDSRATVNAKDREEQEKPSIHPSKTFMKRPAPVEDVVSGPLKLKRKKQRTGLKAARRIEDQAYKPVAEEESEGLERPDKGQASSTTDEGLEINQTTAPKKAKARKSVRFEDLSAGRLQKGTHRRPRREYKESPRGDNLEEHFSSDTSDSDVQNSVAGENRVKDANTRDQREKNEVNHSWRTTRLHRRTVDVEEVQSSEYQIEEYTGEQGADADDFAAEQQLQNDNVRHLGEMLPGHVTVMEEAPSTVSEAEADQLNTDTIETGGPHSDLSSEEASSDGDTLSRTETASFEPSITPSPVSPHDLKILTHYRNLKLLSWQWATTHFSPSKSVSCPNLLHLSTISPSLLTYVNYISACTNQTWEQVFTTHRAILVYCVLGKMLEVHVFGHEAFGISEQQAGVLRGLDLLCVNNDGRLSPLPLGLYPLQ